MKKKLLRLAGIAGLLLGVEGNLSSFPTTNFLAPHEGYYWTSSKYLVPDFHEKGDPKAFRFNFGANVAWGFSGEGRNKDNQTVDLYQIYSDQENTFPVDMTSLNAAGQAMVKAYTSLPILRALNLDPNDTALQLNAIPTTVASEWDVNLFGRLALPIESAMGQFEVAAYLPIKSVDVKTSWDVQEPTTEYAIPLGGLNLISSKLFANGTQNLSMGALTSDVFKKTGIGDLTLLSSWKNHFTQVNSEFSSVGVYAQMGITIPTSKKVDPLNILEYPFGNDNSITLPFGGAININFAKNFRACGAANVVVYLSETSDRLFKTKASEGELFVHQKFTAQRNPGAQVSLVALAEVTSDCKKYSAGIMYQFLKKYEDKFTSNDSNFSVELANGMQRYQEKLTHHISLRASADLTDVVDTEFAPTFSIGCRLPIRAVRMQVYKILDVELTFNF